MHLSTKKTCLRTKKSDQKPSKIHLETQKNVFLTKKIVFKHKKMMFDPNFVVFTHKKCVVGWKMCLRMNFLITFDPESKNGTPTPPKGHFLTFWGGYPQKWGPNPKNGVRTPKMGSLTPKKGGSRGVILGGFWTPFFKSSGEIQGGPFFYPQKRGFLPPKWGVPPFWTKNAVFELKMSGFTTEIVILKKNWKCVLSVERLIFF